MQAEHQRTGKGHNAELRLLLNKLVRQFKERCRVLFGGFESQSLKTNFLRSDHLIFLETLSFQRALRATSLWTLKTFLGRGGRCHKVSPRGLGVLASASHRSVGSGHVTWRPVFPSSSTVIFLSNLCEDCKFI